MWGAGQGRLVNRLGFEGKQTGVSRHAMDPQRPERGGLQLGCCQPWGERNVPAIDLEKTLWFLARGRKWHLTTQSVLH